MSELYSNPRDMPLARLADNQWLATASDSEFEAHVLILIDSGEDAPGVLFTEQHVERLYAAANLHRTQAESKLSDLHTEHAQFQQVCFTQGLAGKKRWFAFDSEWKSRRGDIVQRKSRAEILLQRAKSKRSRVRETDTSRTKAAMEAIEILAKAIAEHRDSIDWSGGESTVSDRALWGALSRARVPSGRAGSISVRDWLMKLTDVREVTSA